MNACCFSAPIARFFAHGSRRVFSFSASLIVGTLFCLSSAQAGRLFPPDNCVAGKVSTLAWSGKEKDNVTCLSVPACAGGESLNFTGTSFVCAPVCESGQSLVLSKGVFSCCSPSTTKQNVQSCPSGETGSIYDLVTTNCDGTTSVVQSGGCSPVVCQPTFSTQNYQSCPSGASGSIYDIVTTNCDGTTSSTTITNCSVSINIQSSGTCSVGQTMNGTLSGGTFTPCSGSSSSCQTYVCTASGLVQQ